MIRRFSKKSWILLISGCLACTGVIFACASDDDFDGDNSGFTPEIFADMKYQPFFYSPNFYYAIRHDEAHEKRFNEANVIDWQVYLGAKTPGSELKYLLEDAPATEIDSALSYCTGRLSSLPYPLQSFGLLQQKKDKKTTAFLTYLSLAKQCEAFAVNDIRSPWDNDTVKKKPFNATRLNLALQQGLATEADTYIKERYWFQLERSHFFNAAPQKVIDLFDAQQGSYAKNTLYYRTMAYAAGAYYKLKNYSKANYYYSKVYDGCDELKTVAHFSFHPQEQADWNNTLALCKSNDERATLWQMLGVFYSDEKRAIHEIYALNPKSEKLELLLTRLVNIQESPGHVEEGNDSAERLAAKDSALSLVSGIADAGNTGKPWFWYTAAGYLHTLSKHYYRAKNYYSLADKSTPNASLPRMQLRLLKLLNTTEGATRIDSKLEQELLPEIVWLKGFKRDSTTAQFRYQTPYAWIRISLSKQYRRQKDLIKSVCFANNPVFYGDSRNVEAMRNFMEKTNKTPWEQLCVDLYVMNKTDIAQYQATRFAFDDKLADAVAKMAQAGENAGKELPGNPFNSRIQDCHDCDHEAAQKVKYTRLSLLQKMKEMEDKITSGDTIYTNALLLGNAFYNISHYGNARFFSEGAIAGAWYYSPFGIDSVFKGFLTDMKMAVKYYTLALKGAQTDEQKAKCTWMLAKCQRNQWYNDYYYNNLNNNTYDYGAKIDFNSIGAFKLMKQYGNTQYYREVIKECGYLRAYSKSPGY